ncbi:hypothetical protein H5410_045043 [Solanum commersonii]|uniref:Uncharacterized protein n=1 Tax=Solanum commersonii TaxID=4109 RepID=A0A9J5X8G9_SOLCO|nr:hypothetical protein H5410_045043 [Solanum commersonii]
MKRILEEERNSKQAIVYTKSTVHSEEFDVILLHNMGNKEALTAYRESLKSVRTKTTTQKGKPKGFHVGKDDHEKKQCNNKEVINLRSLLMNCAQVIVVDD